ncbi:lysozyme inhibitor LprI family protein [Luteimonas suaedae]|uniref:lysozyme inhibitor LprI family protein n=1 Tax=Luteimonas suaedae TaxID=2605430 RepID=UPI0011EF309B|nr:lysozyme inhibitor LprI family protein [Luteimonas suaedae]
MQIRQATALAVLLLLSACGDPVDDALDTSPSSAGTPNAAASDNDTAQVAPARPASTTQNASDDDDCYSKAQSQAELTACSEHDLKPVDDELNKLYREMEARLEDDDDTKKLLIDAQRKWMAFRDAECNLSAARSSGGSAYPMNFNNCATDLTQRRVNDFQGYLNCGKEEDSDDGCVIPGAN